MDSDEDDEEPQNEPGTSSNTQPTVPVFPLSPARISYKFTRTIDQYHLDQFTKEHPPVPVLRMSPLTSMTSTEKENLAQQYKVHEVMTQEEQCSTQTFMF